MLQTRPTSANGMLPMPQGQPGQQYPVSPQRPTFYGGSNGVSGGQIVYRTAPAPIQPYAFTSTPSLNINAARQQQQQNMQSSLGKYSRQPASVSMSNLSTSSTLSGGRYTFGSRDDSSLPNQGSRRGTLPASQTAYMSGTSFQPFAQAASTRVAPERYRRAMPRTVTNPAASVQSQQQKLASAAPSGSGMASIGHLYGSGGSNTDAVSDYRPAGSGVQSQQQLDAHRRNSTHGAAMITMDDMQLYRQSAEDARRYRRRSMPSVDFMNHTTSQVASRKSEPSPRSPDKDKQRVAASSNNLAPGGTMMRNKDGSSESVSSHSGATRPSVSPNHPILSPSQHDHWSSCIWNQENQDTEAFHSLPFRPPCMHCYLQRPIIRAAGHSPSLMQCLLFFPFSLRTGIPALLQPPL